LNNWFLADNKKQETEFEKLLKRKILTLLTKRVITQKLMELLKKVGIEFLT